jgi:hypothetical protein
MDGNNSTPAFYINYNVDHNDYTYGTPEEDSYQCFGFNVFKHDYFPWVVTSCMLFPYILISFPKQTELEEQQTIDPTALMLNHGTRFTQEDPIPPSQPPLQPHEWWNNTLAMENEAPLSSYYPIELLSHQIENLHESAMIPFQSTNSLPSPYMSDNSLSDNFSVFNSNSEPQQFIYSPPPSQEPYIMSPNTFDVPVYPTTLHVISNNDQTASSSLSSQIPPPPSQPSPQQAINNARCKAERDQFIVKCRAQNMSYKEIQKRGNLTMAESTLRGIYRAATIDREERPRKPIWKRKDEKLLLEAVERMSSVDRITRVVDMGTFSGIDMLGISWLKVGMYIKSNGGTLKFGNAVCKKKWARLHGLPDHPEHSKRRR